MQFPTGSVQNYPTLWHCDRDDGPTNRLIVLKCRRRDVAS